MDRKTFTVQPFGKYGPSYKLNRTGYLQYQVLFVVSIVLIGLILTACLAPKLFDKMAPGIDGFPLLPLLPLAAAGLAIWLVTRIVAKGQVIRTDDPGNAQVSEEKPRGYAVLGTLTFIFGIALVGEVVIDHQVNPAVAIGFLLFGAGLFSRLLKANIK